MGIGRIFPWEPIVDFSKGSQGYFQEAKYGEVLNSDFRSLLPLSSDAHSVHVSLMHIHTPTLYNQPLRFFKK